MIHFFLFWLILFSVKVSNFSFGLLQISPNSRLKQLKSPVLKISETGKWRWRNNCIRALQISLKKSLTFMELERSWLENFPDFSRNPGPIPLFSGLPTTLDFWTSSKTYCNDASLHFFIPTPFPQNTLTFLNSFLFSTFLFNYFILVHGSCLILF